MNTEYLANCKSVGVSVALTVLFGPLGLCYTSPGLAILLFLAAVFTIPTVIVPFVIWLVAVIVGISQVETHNKTLAARIK